MVCVVPSSIWPIFKNEMQFLKLLSDIFRNDKIVSGKTRLSHQILDTDLRGYEVLE